jgi:hypothetical protein
MIVQYDTGPCKQRLFNKTHFEIYLARFRLPEFVLKHQ